MKVTESDSEWKETQPGIPELKMIVVTQKTGSRGEFSVILEVGTKESLYLVRFNQKMSKKS